MRKKSRSESLETLMAVVDCRLAEKGFSRVVNVQRDGVTFSRFFARRGGEPQVVTFEDATEDGPAEAITYRHGESVTLPDAPLEDGTEGEPAEAQA